MTKNVLTGQEVQDNLKTYVGLIVKPEAEFTEVHFAMGGKQTSGQAVVMAASLYPKGSAEEVNVAFNTKADAEMCEAATKIISLIRPEIAGTDEEL